MVINQYVFADLSFSFTAQLRLKSFKTTCARVVRLAASYWMCLLTL